MHDISFLLKCIIRWSTTDRLVHFRFDSNIIRCFYTSYYDKDGQIVSGLARSMDRRTKLRIICRYFHKNFVHKLKGAFIVRLQWKISCKTYKFSLHCANGLFYDKFGIYTVCCVCTPSLTGSWWSWSYDSLIYNYLCNQCISLLTL